MRWLACDDKAQRIVVGVGSGQHQLDAPVLGKIKRLTGNSRRVVHSRDRERDGGRGRVGRAVVGDKLKAVRAVVIRGRKVGQIRRRAGQRAMRGLVENREHQRAAFHIRAAQEDIQRSVFRRLERLCIGHRRIVHRLNRYRHGARRRIELAVIGEERETVRPIEVGRRRIEQVRRRAAQHTVRGIARHRKRQRIAIGIAALQGYLDGNLLVIR